jgi:integrase
MALDWKATSQWWYGRFTENGRSKLVNLGIKITGKRPKRINATGRGVDHRIIHSRGMALREHDRIRDEIKSRHNLEELQQKIIELKTGGRMESVKLADLPEAWARIPRSREPDERYAEQCKSTLRRFASFMAERWPQAEELAAVTRDHVAAFMEAETARKVSPKTWNDTLKLLRATFKHLQPEADAYRRFLVAAPTRETETVFRKPFTPEELKAILDAAKDDDFARPLIVAGVCAAMRRGDVCLLKWADVDLERGFITVKTAKTGQTVTIPIFPALNDELQKRKGSGTEYVFPEQAAMYQANPDGITWRVKKVLATAFREDDDEGGLLPELPPDETRRKAHAYLATLEDTAKTRRMKAVFDAYMDGTPGRAIRAAHAISKGTLSGYLNEIEAKTRCRVVRGRHEAQSTAALLKADADPLSADRENGKRRASVRDFHSFRVTWVTLALTAGVPLELVQKVTGHKTVDVVTKHYSQPGREAFRKALESAMPRLLMNGAKSREEQLREIVEKIGSKKLRAQALAVLDGKAGA